MANKILKLILLGDIKQVVYCYMPTTFSDIVSAIKNNFPKENADGLRKYWFDEDDDRVDILNQESYEIFLIKSTEKKIYLMNVMPNFITITQELINSPSKCPEKVIHSGISCDECEEYPIRGYRYMCIQCDNYDICMKCEAKMKHSEHIMIRLAHPIDSTFATKRLVKKIRRGIKLPQDEKFHSRRHHRGHGSVFNSIYTMMHDLADADIPEEQPTASAPPPEPNQSKKRETNQEQKQRRSRTSPRCPFARGAETRRVEIPVIDIPAVHIGSEYLEAGVKILNNFSQMFTKKLDPMGGGAYDGTVKKDDKNEKDNNDDKPESPMGEESTQKPTAETSNSVNEDNTTEEQKGNSKKTRESGQSSSRLPSVSIVEPSSISDSANPDYEELRQQLLEHIEKEQEAAAPTAPVALKPRVETQKYQIVYHKEKHINDAVITMMSMGFSNEGQWLTHLLDSVNGNIGQALDLLKPAQ